MVETGAVSYFKRHEDGTYITAYQIVSVNSFVEYEQNFPLRNNYDWSVAT